jgi:hypothetical protein
MDIHEFEEAELVEEKELPRPEKKLPSVKNNRRSKFIKISLILLIIALLVILFT